MIGFHSISFPGWIQEPRYLDDKLTKIVPNVLSELVDCELALVICTVIGDKPAA
jgi:hypothetical protein